MRDDEKLTVIRPNVQHLPPGFMQAPQAPSFRCPFCQSTAGVIHTSKTSQAGCVMAIILFLVLCWPLFWLGFLMRDNYTVCRTCGMKLS
jgi:hypothetical protein